MILKNFNRQLFCAVQIISIFSFAFAFGQLRNQRDRDIVKDVLATFGKECALRAATDGDLLGRLDDESARAQKVADKNIIKCFESYYSQVTGVFHLYKKICSEVSANGPKVSEPTMARQLIDISKYQSGIRPYHSSLNECLTDVPERAGRSFVVPLAGTELDVGKLQRQLDEAAVKLPFAVTVEPFR